ncbi:MAG: hypothetical protein K2L83_07490 [Muribaculaceae bacterium]|nr:hypothetical protein [Muribaculaceae bacterium]
MKNEEIDFIARHYRKGRFNADSGWRRLGIATVSRWKRYRVAAAVAAAVVLSATAAIIYHEYRAVDLPEPAVVAPAATVSALAEVKVIDFENASLAEVVRRIEEVYNVRVENLPDNDEAYELSLHYEGTPKDLIGVINDILGTQMTVAEK